MVELHNETAISIYKLYMFKCHSRDSIATHANRVPVVAKRCLCHKYCIDVILLIIYSHDCKV